MQGGIQAALGSHLHLRPKLVNFSLHMRACSLCLSCQGGYRGFLGSKLCMILLCSTPNLHKFRMIRS